MELPTDLLPSPAISDSDLDKVRLALRLRYPSARNVLGSQLGMVVRAQLDNPSDLKTKFGGLKSFVTQYFPTEISWRGRKGLDDLFDLSFQGADLTQHDGTAWQSLQLEPSTWLWAAITNPSTVQQFAWSTKDQTLMSAPVGVPLREGLKHVEKLTRGDYQQIARSFVEVQVNIDKGRYLQTIESSDSSMEFTALVRGQGLLSSWEGFRVNSALQLFGQRLETAGSSPSIAAQWLEALRASQGLVRDQRVRKGQPPSPPSKTRLPSTDQGGLNQLLEARSVASKAIEFLSDAELSGLMLPLGSVMRALRTLSSAK
jgi:hypothetical protein